MVLSRCSLRAAPLLTPYRQKLVQDRTLTTEEKLRMRYLRLKQAKVLKVPSHIAVRRSESKCGQVTDANCLEDPCGAEPLPLDLAHYRPTNKECRCYQRTWCESVPIPRPVHQPFDKIYPERKRRDPKKLANKNLTACNPNDIVEKPRSRAKLFELFRGPLPCCKMTAPGCKEARKDPTCANRPQPSCCVKRSTKYPSFSECRKYLGPPNPICECNKKPSTCEMWTYFRNKRS
ncbi:uncharacterized protein Dwil_GK19521 [Drosophila willistoni]|uniref:Uncharacterized protein n=1 Tax=Drosophila willistoni TaxID=7260 RepID=B4MNR6_DROWI|nr:uncharacterized protein LOC6639845 [Drosophila willistoni]EDW73755.1 uncharacterized protein Dwil_GK19521 [Drosophila willistoni]